MTEQMIKLVDLTLEKHEEIHQINEQIIEKQKEIIKKLAETVETLKDIINAYILKDVTL